MITRIQFFSGRYAFAWGLLLVWGVFWSGCRPGSDLSERVQLRMTTREIEPGTCFEVVFQDPIVSADQVGISGVESPLVVDPSLPGEFVWRSRRVGLFRPLQPLQLGTAYVFGLRKGLRGFDGVKIPSRLYRRIETPSLEVEAQPMTYWDASSMPGYPEVLVSANSPLDLTQFAARAEFHDGTRQVPVRVEPLTLKGWSTHPLTRDISLPALTWRDRFPSPHPRAAPPIAEREEGAVFRVRPRSMLVSTSGWSLRLPAGLASADGAARLKQPLERSLGTSAPFVLKEVRPFNTVQQGRHVALHFSRLLDPRSATNLNAWFQVTPAVSNLTAKASPRGRHVEVLGEFSRDVSYRIRIGSGLRSADGPEIPPSLMETDPFVFGSISSAVWFPAYSEVQLAAGRRDFELRAINTSSVRLRVKALGRAGLIPALNGYERYLEAVRAGSGPKGPVDYTALPGRTVLDTHLNVVAAIDEVKRIPLGWDRLVGARKTGAYFIEAEYPRQSVPASVQTPVWPQSLVQLTDLGYVVKRGQERTWVWVVSYSKAQPVVGAQVSLRDPEDVELAAGVTDAEGLVSFPNQAQARWISVQYGDDLHVGSLSQGQVWNGGVRGTDSSPTGRVWSFTDREAYHPGDLLHLHALVRRWGGQSWQLPSSTSLSLTLQDPRGQLALKTNLMVTTSGSADWQWSIPDRVRGTYELILESEGCQERRSVEVREFQPPAFEVQVRLPPILMPGQPLEVAVEARYLLGQSVTSGRVLWQIEAEDIPFQPDGWDGFHFPDGSSVVSERGDSRSAHASVSGEAALTDGKGVRLHPDLPPHPHHPTPQKIRVHAEVMDPNQQTVAQVAEAVRPTSDFYLGFRWAGSDEAVQTAQTPLRFHCVPVALDGSPWTAPVEVLGTLRRVEWDSVVVERAGGGLAFEQHRKVSVEGTRPVQVSPVIRQGVVWRAKEGQGMSSAGWLAAAGPGSYELELETVDTAGRPVRTVVPFQVSGEAHLAWHWQNGSRLGLIPDRPVSEPGETNTLLVEAPFGGTAWITLEREEVRMTTVTRLSGNAPAVRVPVGSGSSPNVHVGVFLLRGLEGNPHENPMPEWRAGWLDLPVSSAADRLRVQVGLNAAERMPGEEVQVTVDVSDIGGVPAAGSEVTLYAVDEGFLLLKGTTVPDPVSVFGEHRPLGVETIQSFSPLMPEDPQMMHFTNKGEVGGGGGRRGLSQRRKFVPCPLWETKLVTDPQGRLKARFRVPDSLTRYRVVAVATQGAVRMGSGSTSFEVKKPLMIESGLPRFAHVGDRLQARAMVLNSGTQSMEALVRLGVPSKGVSIAAEKRSQKVTVPPGASASVEFTVVLTEATDEAWTWSVESAAPSDEVVVRMPVTRGLPDLSASVWARVDREQTNLLASIDPTLLETVREMVVRISVGPLGFAGAGADWLLEYPHGCVEQTSSKLVPWLVAQQHPGLLGGVDSKKIQLQVEAGIHHLWSMQTPSGGLAYWPGQSEPQEWGSAYAAWVLSQAQRLGFQVDSERQARLLRWLGQKAQDLVSDPAPKALQLRCFLAMALAAGQRADASLNATLLSKVDQLTPSSRALLVMAVTGDESSDAAGRRQARALLAPPRKSWSRSREYAVEEFWDAARAPALRLLAGTELGIDDAALDRDAVLLFQEANGGRWTTTQGNAWALWAFAQRLVKQEMKVSGRWTLGGREFPVSLETAQAIQHWKVPVTPGEMAAGLRFRMDAGVPFLVHVSVVADNRVDPALVPVMDHGFQVRRTYERLDERNRPTPAQALRVGDRVLITLKLDVPEDADWLVIEDPLPSILEPLQGVFQTEGSSRSPSISEWNSDFWEIRGDRVRHFRNHLQEGVHILRYIARVRAVGDVVAPPARVEAMYDPDRFGQSQGGRLRSME